MKVNLGIHSQFAVVLVVNDGV